jgi:hypothetical protein
MLVKMQEGFSRVVDFQRDEITLTNSKLDSDTEDDRLALCSKK